MLHAHCDFGNPAAALRSRAHIDPVRLDPDASLDNTYAALCRFHPFEALLLSVRFDTMMCTVTIRPIFSGIRGVVRDCPKRDVA